MTRPRDPIIRLTCCMLIAGLAVGAGCSSDSARRDAASVDAPGMSDGPLVVSDRGADRATPPDASGDQGVAPLGCAGRLSAVAIPNAKVVGSGSTASCTEQALRSPT